MLVHPWPGLHPAHRTFYEAGVKLASQQTPAYNLSGVLQVVEHGGKPWGLLSVPNALARGVFQAMTEPGIELPPGDDGRFNAHISVFRPEEIEMIGGPDTLRHERGKRYLYTLGRLVSVDPEGWPEIARCWMIRVHSPQLQELRRSYGLSSLPRDGEFDFHVTVAVRRRGVLARNGKAKATD